MKLIYRTFRILRKQLPLQVFMFTLIFVSCEKFTEVDPPDHQLTGTVVFEDASTVDAAFAHIYSELRDNAFTDGTTSGLTYLMGHYTDELDLYNLNFQNVQYYADNNVLASDGNVRSLWNSSYNLIHASNSIVEGVQASINLSQDNRNRFLGEAYFLRAFIHFYLMNLFGDVPYIDTTDYRINSTVGRLDEALVQERIITDLLTARELLPTTGTTFRPNHWVASALLARIYLYKGNWAMALEEANHVLTDGGYTLNLNLNQVFKKTSTETLWQLDTGTAGANTKEAFTFVFMDGPPPYSALSDHLLESFEVGDARLDAWVGSATDGKDVWYFPNKYKLNTNTATTEECSILFRLAELYLIAAEAEAHMGHGSEALDHLNTIRNRAMLAPITATDQISLLNAIEQERRIELFSEQGHRFFDLKRTGRADSELAPVKPNWESTDVLLPIPESELLLNPNLEPQNDGY